MLTIFSQQSKKSPAEFAEEIVEEVEEFNGFNLVVLDIKLKSMLYITNRPEHGTSFVTEVSPGIHVLTNARLDSPWPKVNRFCVFHYSVLIQSNQRALLLRLTGSTSEQQFQRAII